MIDRKLAKQVTGVDPEQARIRWETLTPREREVAEKLARGFSNAKIAEDLKISPKTLDIHRAKVKQKLEVETPAGVAMHFFAIRLAELK